MAKPHSLDLPTAQDHCLAKSQSVSQSPHSNPSSSSPPDLRVRRSNAILGPHAIGMSSHASYTPSPFTLDTTLYHACTILVPVDVSDNGKGRIAREIHRRNISNPDFSSPIHISTLSSHDPMSPSCWSLNGPISAFDASIQFSQR